MSSSCHSNSSLYENHHGNLWTLGLVEIEIFQGLMGLTESPEIDWLWLAT